MLSRSSRELVETDREREKLFFQYPPTFKVRPCLGISRVISGTSVMMRLSNIPHSFIFYLISIGFLFKQRIY